MNEERRQADLFAAFAAGFLESGEGYNGEYWGSHLEKLLRKSPQGRDEMIKALLEKLRPAFEEWHRKRILVEEEG